MMSILKHEPKHTLWSHPFYSIEELIENSETKYFKLVSYIFANGIERRKIY